MLRKCEGVCQKMRKLEKVHEYIFTPIKQFMCFYRRTAPTQPYLHQHIHQWVLLLKQPVSNQNSIKTCVTDMEKLIWKILVFCSNLVLNNLIAAWSSKRPKSFCRPLNYQNRDHSIPVKKVLKGTIFYWCDLCGPHRPSPRIHWWLWNHFHNILLDLQTMSCLCYRLDQIFHLLLNKNVPSRVARNPCIKKFKK